MLVTACLLDLALVVDHSGSIMDSNPPGVSNWQFIIEFMVRLVSTTRTNVGAYATHVGAVSYGTQLYFFILESLTLQSIDLAGIR